MGLAWWEKALLVGLPALMAVTCVGLVSGVARKPAPEFAAQPVAEPVAAPAPVALTPEQAIRAYLAKRFASAPERVVNVEVERMPHPDRLQASVYVRASDNLTVGMIRDGALMDACEVIRDLASAPDVAPVDLFDVSLTFPLRDALNRQSDQQVMRAKLAADVARQVNWDGLYDWQCQRLLEQAGTLYMHPALTPQD